MRRWLIALATALVAGALWAGAAYADAGPHGNFNANNAGATTYRCASCHRAHTAQGPELLKTSSTYALCTSCHGQTSGLDALDGVEWGTTPTTPGGPGVIDGGNKAGGFLNSFMNTTLSTTAPTTYAPSTSAHRVAGMPLAGGGTSSGSYVAWGIGTAAGAGNTITITCGTCHDPHGGSGGIDSAGKRIPTYRILRADIAGKLPGSGAGPKVIVPEDTNTSHVYTVADVTLPVSTNWPTGGLAPEAYYGQSYANTDMKALNNWCATCHTRIHTSDATNHPGSTPTTDSIFTYRHATTGTSTEINLGTTTYWPGGSPGCVTCHTSHGSSAKNVGRNGATLKVEVPGGDPVNGPFLDSSLLRLDSRGVCEVCHNK